MERRAQFLVGSLVVGVAFIALGWSSTTGAAGHASTSAVLARKALLVASDFPRGWKAGSVGRNSPKFPSIVALASCAGDGGSVLPSRATQAVTPEYDDIAKNLAVDEVVQVFATNRAASLAVGSLADPKTPGCLADVLNRVSFTDPIAQSLGAEVTIGTISVEALAARARHQAAALVITIPVGSDSSSVRITLKLVAVVSGRIEAELTYVASPGPFPAQTESRLEAIVWRRIAPLSSSSASH